MIRDVAAADHAVLCALNNAAVPHVNSLEVSGLEELLEMAAHARVVERDGALAALLVAFAPGAAYPSANYRWFATRYDAFLYVDRVVVDPTARGRGIARALYDDLAAVATARAARHLTCEVNERPPNPGSLAFHERLGFAEVGRQQTGAKAVILVARELG